jgi:hypothetical protein
LKKNHLVLGLVVLVGLVALGIYAHQRYPFNWHEFLAQFRLAKWRTIGIATGTIYLAYVLRSVRWAYLLRHNKRVPLLSLLGTQVMGFTAVALIGRVADPVRPYLVSKKTDLPLSNQIAVYVVERLLDFGTMALIFSLALFALSSGSMPHPEAVRQHGHWGPLTTLVHRFPAISEIVTRFGGLILTLIGALFLVAVRLAGEAVATFFESAFGLVSKGLGQAVGHKIRAFRAGLDAMRSFSDFSMVAGLSLGMWGLISFAYLETCLAFTASSQLASMTLPKSIVLMMISGGASIFQLPVIGWFTQIGVVAAALSTGFDVAKEAATACAATILLVTFLSIVPVGLVWAQFEHVSLRKIAQESEEASEEADVHLKSESTQTADTPDLGG